MNRLIRVHISLVIALYLFVTVAHTVAKPTTYVVRKEDSQVEFTITKWVVMKEQGRFKDYYGTISYDPSTRSLSSVELVIQTASIDSRNNDRDQVIRSDDYLQVAKYPTMRFLSVKSEVKDDKTLLVTGDFTIRDVTKRITVPVTLLGTHTVGGDLGELIAFETTFTINRLDYGVGAEWNVLGNDVTIHLIIGASSKGHTARR